MIGVLIALIVLVVVVVILRQLLPLLGLPQPVTTAILLLVGLIAFLYLVSYLGYGGPLLRGRL